MNWKPLENAYWIDPYGDFHPVKGGKHIQSILQDPDQFGLKREYVVEKFKKYGEKLGQEGKAREELMVDLMMDGWIQVRKQKRNNAWTILTSKINNPRNRIWDFFAKLFYDKKSDEFRQNDPGGGINSEVYIMFGQRKEQNGEVKFDMFDNLTIKSTVKELLSSNILFESKKKRILLKNLLK